MGEIITFYSYKGGVGRTMALANVAVLLAKWNYKVLVVDWDIEAPGLEYYFKEYVKLSDVYKKKGVIDLLKDIENISSYGKRALNKCVTRIRIPGAIYGIHLVSAGIRDEEYFGKVQKMDIDNIYNNKDGGENIESLRGKWKSYYDFILIDSRTGVTDFGGICTVQLPDMLVLFFGANEQSLNGAIKVARKILMARQNIPIERLLLTVLPVAGRFDSQEEFKISREWLNTFAESLEDFYADWLPASIKVQDIVEMTKIPYIPYFSFGEKLPVIEQGTNDPTSIGYAYENLSALIANKLEQVELFSNNRDEYVSKASRDYEKGVFIERIVSKKAPDSRKYKEAYLDIETTGLSPMDAEIMIVGVYLVGDGDGKVIQMSGEEVNKKELLKVLRGVETIYTYNGSRFDIPFIKYSIGIDIEEEFRHIDLMYACWRRSLYGGLKAVEVQLGIPRSIRGTSGYDAIRLWREYISNQNTEALAKLLASNREDITNLKRLRDKIAHLSEASISLDSDMGIIPLVGIEADGIDVTSYVNQLKNSDKSQDIKRIYRLTKSEFDSLLIDTIDNLNKLDVPEGIKTKDIIMEAEKFISGFESLTNNVEKFALASAQENYSEGLDIVLKFAGDWISISEKRNPSVKTRFVKGLPALMAWRMLCLSGAKALEEEEFEALRIILSESIEVEENQRFTNLSLIQRRNLFHPESMLGNADLAVRYLSKLWNDKLHLHSYFISDEAYNFAVAKFFILVALVSPEDKYGNRLYPGYRLLTQARRAMSSFCSKLAASDKYLTNIAKLIGESSEVFRASWSQRVESTNRIKLGSGYFLIDEVRFPDEIEADIPD